MERVVRNELIVEERRVLKIEAVVGARVGQELAEGDVVRSGPGGAQPLGSG